ncbi:MAG: hypothetical protein WC457_01285 [Patescibacteria group bacterium]
MFFLRCALQAALFTLFALIAGVFVTPAFGIQMQSGNWIIEQDAVDFGGGWGASDSYIEEDSYGEIATGWSYSDDYSLHAGYQQMDDDTYISLTINTSTTLLPAILGLSGGTANAAMASTIQTNNDWGYSLQIYSSTSPALTKDSDSFADYTVSSSAPDYTWSINNTDSEFGFTPEGSDLIQTYLDNGSNTCNVSGGSDATDACWDKFTTVAKTLSRSNYLNETGATTTIKLRAQSGSGHVQPAGTYHALLILTAVVN